MKIYLIRHGETEWNKIERLQGWQDSQLSDQGLGAALKLREELINVHFDIAFSSDLNRAVHTAEIIIESRKIPLVKLPHLRELALGQWEGQILQDLQRGEEAKDLNIYFNSPHLHKIENTEDFHDLMNRVEDFFEEYIYNSNYESVLVVSHGVTISAIFNYVEKIPLENFWKDKIVKGTQLSILQYENKKLEIVSKAPFIEGNSY